MKNILILLILVSLTLPFVNADLINPGFHSLNINNKITNIADFPDYSFISVCYLGIENNSNNICGASKVEDDGTIYGCYKFASLYVYAVKKSDLDNEILKDSLKNFDRLSLYLDSLNKTLVLENLEHYKQVPVSSTQKEINNDYTVDFAKVKTTPDKREISRNNLIYYYICVPIIALVIIAIIIIRKYRR